MIALKDLEMFVDIKLTFPEETGDNKIQNMKIKQHLFIYLVF